MITWSIATLYVGIQAYLSIKPNQMLNCKYELNLSVVLLKNHSNDVILRYFTGERQDSQLIVLVVFGAMD